MGTGIKLQRVHVLWLVGWWVCSLCCRGLGWWLRFYILCSTAALHYMFHLT